MQNCSFCGNKNIKNAITDYTYKRNGKYLLIKNVPCSECTFCGEKYFKTKVLKQIENEFNNIHNMGKKVVNKIVMPVENFKEFAIA